MWKQIKPNTKTFQFGEEPELIHITKTGHEDQYIVSYEDAYQYLNGYCELLTSNEIKIKFNIDLKDIELRESFPANIEGSQEFNKTNLL